MTDQGKDTTKPQVKRDENDVASPAADVSDIVESPVKDFDLPEGDGNRRTFQNGDTDRDPVSEGS